MINGVIAMVDEGAIAFTSKDLANPLMYDNSPRAGRGVGKEQWGSINAVSMPSIALAFSSNLIIRSSITAS
jgi:hypothetical protein